MTEKSCAAADTDLPVIWRTASVRTSVTDRPSRGDDGQSVIPNDGLVQ